MTEFLIQRIDGEWFEFKDGDDVYKPTKIPFKKIEGIDGYDGYKIEIDGCLISFSFEDPGIQVSFEGNIDELYALKITEEIKENIERITKQKGEVIQIS